MKKIIALIVTLCMALGMSSVGVWAESNPVTWNPNVKGSNVTLSNNNLTADIYARTANTTNYLTTTDGRDSGKWYWEVRVDYADNDSFIIGTSSANNSGYYT